MFNAITKRRRARGDEASAPDRRRRWSTPIWPAARSTIWSASPCRRCCGASCPAPARPAACSRWRCASSATARTRSRSSRPRILVGRGRRWRRRAATSFVARLVGVDGKQITRLDIGTDEATARRVEAALKAGDYHGRRGRGEAGQAQPAAALHHLDPAAGGLAQARLLRRTAPCRSPSASMRASNRRRDGRPHHLYADRRRRSGARGDRRDPRGHRQTTIGERYVPEQRRATTRPRPRTPRKRTRRSARPIRRAAGRRCAARSRPTRRGSTS